MSLVGEYRHTIDAKGRLIVPSRLRPDLEGEVVLTRYTNDCIAVWPQEGWEQFQQWLAERRRGADPQTQTWVRMVLASAFVEEIDKQGRVTLPPTLRDFGGISRDVVVTGQLSHVEIWDAGRWEQQSEQIDFSEMTAGMSF